MSLNESNLCYKLKLLLSFGSVFNDMYKRYGEIKIGTIVRLEGDKCDCV